MHMHIEKPVEEQEIAWQVRKGIFIGVMEVAYGVSEFEGNNSRKSFPKRKISKMDFSLSVVSSSPFFFATAVTSR